MKEWQGSKWPSKQKKRVIKTCWKWQKSLRASGWRSVKSECMCTKVVEGWEFGGWGHPNVKTWDCGGECRDACFPGRLFPAETLQIGRPYSEAWQDYWWLDTWSAMISPGFQVLTCKLPPVKRGRRKGEVRHCMWSRDETECGHVERQKERELRVSEWKDRLHVGTSSYQK